MALGTWRLSGCTLVVTLEPCTMCAGALVLARVSRVVFGALDPKAGAVGSLWDVVRDRRLNHRPEVVGGVLADGVRFADPGVLRGTPRGQLGSPAVESRSGRARTPRKRVRVKALRGFKSHLHRHPETTFPQVTGLRDVVKVAELAEWSQKWSQKISRRGN